MNNAQGTQGTQNAKNAKNAKMGKLGHSACILLAGSCWGLTGLCNRFITPYGFSQSQILFMRGFIALALLTVYMVIFRRDAFKIKLKDFWVFLGSGVLSLTMFGLAYMNAMQEMSLSLAVVLLYTSPVFVIVLSAPLFKERITPAKIAAVVLIIAGAICATNAFAGNIAVSGIGLAYGVIAGLGYGLYSIFTRFAFQRGYCPLTVTFYTFLLSSAALIFICNPIDIPSHFTEPNAVVWAVILGVVTCLVPYILYTKGLEGVENGTASILATIEVVVTTLVSALFFQEPFGIANFVGIVLVLLGIVVMNVKLPSKKPPKSPTA